MTDLDDFFAKKDKKKSKSKTKFLTTDELVKNLEDTSKRETAAVKAKKVETISSETTVSNAVPESTTSTDAPAAEEKPIVVKTLEQTEEEWKEFEEEQRKDYTGLKIGQLTLNEDDDYSPTDGDDEEGDSENISNNMFVNSSSNGPWKKVVPAEEVTQIQMESTTTTTNTTRGLYVSPAMRHQTRTAPRARKAAPDITNADYFPSLGAARPEEQRKKKNEPAFEEVRHGGRVQRVAEPTVAKAPAASNRFQSLDEEDS